MLGVGLEPESWVEMGMCTKAEAHVVPAFGGSAVCEKVLQCVTDQLLSRAMRMCAQEHRSW